MKIFLYGEYGGPFKMGKKGKKGPKGQMSQFWSYKHIFWRVGTE